MCKSSEEMLLERCINKLLLFITTDDITGKIVSNTDLELATITIGPIPNYTLHINLI